MTILIIALAITGAFEGGEGTGSSPSKDEGVLEK